MRSKLPAVDPQSHGQPVALRCSGSCMEPPEPATSVRWCVVGRSTASMNTCRAVRELWMRKNRITKGSSAEATYGGRITRWAKQVPEQRTCCTRILVGCRLQPRFAPEYNNKTQAITCGVPLCLTIHTGGHWAGGSNTKVPAAKQRGGCIGTGAKRKGRTEWQWNGSALR